MTRFGSRTLARAKARWAIVVALATALPVVGLACKKREPPPAPMQAAPLPEAPEGLLGELLVAHPSRTAAALAGWFGGPASGFLSQSAAMIGTALQLPPRSWTDLDLDLPAYGVARQADVGADFALALHVRDGSRLVDSLAGSKENAFAAAPDAPSGLVVLVRKTDAGKAPAFALAVLDNYLLIANRAEGARLLGPYLVRTMPSRPLANAATDDAVLTFPRSAWSGALPARLIALVRAIREEREADALSMQRRHGPSTPDLGDVSAALADLAGDANRVAALLPDVGDARAVLRIDDGGVHARAQIRGSTPDGPVSRFFGAWTVGDAAPLLALPSSTVLAVLARDGKSERSRAAEEQSAALGRVLEGRLAGADQALFARFLARWAKGRGDWVVAGALATPGALSAFYRAPAKDAKLVDESASDLARLFDVPSLHAPLATFWGELSRDSRARDVASPDATTEDPTIVRLIRKPARLDNASTTRSRGDEPFDVAWKLKDGVLTCSAGEDALFAFRTLVSPDETKTLGRTPATAAALSAAGSDASFLLFAEPLRFGLARPKGKVPAPPPASAPAVLAYGRTGAEAWLRIDVANATARAILDAYLTPAQSP